MQPRWVRRRAVEPVVAHGRVERDAVIVVDVCDSRVVAALASLPSGAQVVHLLSGLPSAVPLSDAAAVIVQFQLWPALSQHKSHAVKTLVLWDVLRTQAHNCAAPNQRGASTFVLQLNASFLAIC